MNILIVKCIDFCALASICLNVKSKSSNDVLRPKAAAAGVGAGSSVSSSSASVAEPVGSTSRPAVAEPALPKAGPAIPKTGPALPPGISMAMGPEPGAAPSRSRPRGRGSRRNLEEADEDRMANLRAGLQTTGKMTLRGAVGHFFGVNAAEDSARSTMEDIHGLGPSCLIVACSLPDAHSLLQALCEI